MNKNKKINYSRKLISATMAGALIISLSSCSGATNTNGNIQNEVYAQAGDYSITNQELWEKSLQWQTKDLLNTQVTNVVLKSSLEKIDLVLNTSDFSKLTDDEKKSLGLEEKTADDFKSLQDWYKERLSSAVIRDIYNFNYSNDNESEDVSVMKDKEAELLEQKYVDEMYTKYQTAILNTTATNDSQAIIDCKEKLKELRSSITAKKNAGDDDFTAEEEVYFSIANKFKNLYYVSFAKEVLAYDEIVKEMNEQNKLHEEDEDEDPYHTESSYVSKFKSEYINKQDLYILPIRFASATEYNETLRAFGLKFYKNKLYLINDEPGKEMTYDEYVKYYDKFSNSDFDGTTFDDVDATKKATLINNEAAVLEIFIQIYNYIYGGYTSSDSSSRKIETTLAGNVVTSETTIEQLRKISAGIANDRTLDINAITQNIKANDKYSHYTSKELNALSTSVATYVYDSLVVPGTNDASKLPYTTSSQSTSNGYYMIYKLEDCKNELPEDTLEYIKDYNNDLSTEDVYDKCIEGKDALIDQLTHKLNIDKITETVMNNYVNEKIEDVKVKIYNEALEISYTTDHSDYSKAIGSADNENILATIEYEDTTYNLNILKDDNDKNSLTQILSDEKIGAYNELERTNGATSAIDLLSQEIVKDTKAYKDILEEEEENFKTTLESILYYFANDGYSQSGYPSTIGKYNFLMLYFHDSNVDNIIKNYYAVQYASSELLTDYSNDSLVQTVFKPYSEKAIDSYFSLSGKRLVVYYDADEDNTGDSTSEWSENIITEGDFIGKTLGTAAKQLVLDIYTRLAASSENHATKLDSLVEEINNSARAEYSSNPIVNESKWAKYKKLGLNVKTEDVAATNSTTDIDFALKKRIYEYATDPAHSFFINNTAPSVYLETITEADVTSGDKIVKTDDGYNLLLITKAEVAPSTKWSKEDNKEGIYDDITINYNDKFITIKDIYNENENDKYFTENQIKLYVLDYAINGSSLLSPSSTSSAITTFLKPVMTRFTAAETQRIILLSFINQKANNNANTALYDVIKFTSTSYNGENGVFNNLIRINQSIVDNYISIYDDPTGTANQFDNWWTQISSGNFLHEEEK